MEKTLHARFSSKKMRTIIKRTMICLGVLAVLYHKGYPIPEIFVQGFLLALALHLYQNKNQLFK